MGEPCGMPRRLSRAPVVRVIRPRSSVSSTGQSSHILIRCSTRRSTIRRATDFKSSAWGMLPKFRRALHIADTVEAEAMPAQMLRRLLREKVENFMPEGALSAARAAEEFERAGLALLWQIKSL